MSACCGDLRIFYLHPWLLLMKLLQLGLKFDYFVFLINELLIAWKCYPLLKAFLQQFFLVSMADCSWLLGLRSCTTMTGKYWSLSNSSCLWNMMVQLRLFVYGSSVPHKDIGELRLIVSLLIHPIVLTISVLTTHPRYVILDRRLFRRRFLAVILYMLATDSFSPFYRLVIVFFYWWVEEILRSITTFSW